MISKVYFYHLFWVKDYSFQSSSLESIPVVNEFQKVYQEDLSRVPPKREIDLGIDLLPDVQPISIPPYIMAPYMIREWKNKLKDYLDKVFIIPSISAWGAPLLFVKKKDDSVDCALTINC